jgi:hypothetical protein
MKPNRFPDISITSEVYRKINAFADLCDNEISALGSVNIVDNTIVIDDIFLFEQVVTASSTDLSTKDISEFLCDYINKGKDPSTLKFWWHSHVNMGVFWSATDNSTIDRFSSDWMISMVSNKRNEFKLRVDMFSPFRMYMDDLPLNIDYDRTFNASIKKEIDLKVKHQYLPDLRDILHPKQSIKYPSDTSYNKKVMENDTFNHKKCIGVHNTPSLNDDFGLSPSPTYIEQNNKLPEYREEIGFEIPPKRSWLDRLLSPYESKTNRQAPIAPIKTMGNPYRDNKDILDTCSHHIEKVTDIVSEETQIIEKVTDVPFPTVQEKPIEHISELPKRHWFGYLSKK